MVLADGVQRPMQVWRTPGQGTRLDWRRIAASNQQALQDLERHVHEDEVIIPHTETYGACRRTVLARTS